jgi:hypothetical protein
MRAAVACPSTQDEPVTVFVGKKDKVKQPEGFRLCPLGVQFYSSHKIQEFECMEFKIQVPGNGKRKSSEITATGVVVNCKQEKSNARFRVWIKFLDLPEADKSRIQCVAKSGKHLCPYCENF